MTRVTRSFYYGWFPRYPEVHREFVKQKVTKAHNLKHRVLRTIADKLPSPNTEPPLIDHIKHIAKYFVDDPVAEFAKAILNDDYMYNTLEKVFLQVNTDPKWVDPNYVVTNLPHFLYLLYIIVHEPPAYYIATRADGSVIGEPIGVPMGLTFDMLTNTTAGYDLFRYEPFNVALKKLLDSWGSYLQTEDSNSSLNTGPQGWFSEQGIQDLESNLAPYTFDTTYVCPDSSADNKGFSSWDAFFVRAVQDQARPLQLPGRTDIIHNACESTTLRISNDVKLHDTFWLKEQPYSLYDMLGADEDAAKKFVGGTVYQAFLSPQDYHRWHSPIDGTITKVVLLPGTYYACLPDEGAPPPTYPGDLKEGDPHCAMVRSQAWLTTSATRTLIYIQADNNAIGLMCFIAVGMVEVSTCEITVQEGWHVSAGDQLGLFHFGGSSHALVFGRQVNITFKDFDGDDIEPNTHYWVKTVIGTVASN